MKYGVALSQHPVPSQAAGEVIGSVLEQVGEAPDLAVLFASRDLTGALDDVVAAIRALLRPGALVGTTAGMVLAGGREVEDDTALALWAGRPGPVATAHLVAEPADGGVVVAGVPSDLPERGTALLLADPWSFPVDGLLAHLAEARPGLVLAGGLASAAQGPGGNRLVVGDEVHSRGAVLALLPPDAPVATGVSQGCVPVGDPMIVTRADGQSIQELAGRPAMERLGHVVEQAAADERAALVAGLQLGIVVDEGKEEFTTGDFLVRSLLGADRATGALVVGEAVAVGTTVQFHQRSAEAADVDLQRTLGRLGPATGALVFTCNGRGTHLFGEPDHDAEAVAALVPAVAGMSCAGEVGPVGGASHLHGFSASMVLFR